jgi:hypothetical protein
VRSNDDTGDDITQDHRLSEPMKDNRHHPGDDHHNGQILEKSDRVHDPDSELDTAWSASRPFSR